MPVFDTATFQGAFTRLSAQKDRLQFQGEHSLVSDLAVIMEVVYAGYVQGELLNTQLAQILERITTMAGELDTLTAQVASNTTVIDSAVQLLQGLKSALDAAIAANNAGDNGAALLALSQNMATEDTKLAAAITANTPAAPTPIPVPPPPPAPAPGPAPSGSGTTP